VNVGEERRPLTRGRPRTLVRVAALAAVVVLSLGGYVAWVLIAGGLPTSVPSCSWPLTVRGPATSEQAGLIRCYLRALASHDTGGLLSVADSTSTPVRITSADFRHAADAHAGTATATFVRGENDDAFAVTIVFADHAREDLAMGLANPGSVHSWRLGIGTPIGSDGPLPTKPSP
jgi:hypothetical protein